ncbi:MAG: pyridoxamine 5'-phosphate oxidase family protein [Paracoccaceae bacterium]
MAQDDDVFHAGETAIQNRAEVPSSHIAKVSEFVRPEMPEQHRAFFESLPILHMGFLDRKGRVWASPVIGQPGFMTAPNPRSLTVAALPVLEKELDLDLATGAKVGAVGLELHTRRRNRMNGTLAQGKPGQMSINVDQSFGNCPKYIQARTLDWAQSQDLRPKPRKLATFDQEAKTLIENADTLVIASRVKTPSDAPDQGVDASHRGGKPGFIHLNADGSLSFPDFSGNRFFNTLGNIEVDGRVGLFIPDFESGTALFITGRASIDWDSPRVAAFERADRIVDVVPEEIWVSPQALPKQAALPESSPFLRGTGSWRDAH